MWDVLVVAKPELQSLTLALAVPHACTWDTRLPCPVSMYAEAMIPAVLRPEAILSAAPSVRTLSCDPGQCGGCPLQGPPLATVNWGSWLIPQVNRAGAGAKGHWRLA